MTGSAESELEPAAGACFSFSERAVAKAQRKEAWDGTKSRRHVVHVCWERRAKMDGNLMRQVQSKVSQILNKSKGTWKAFSLLRALSSRMTDQAQVEAEELRSGHMGEIGGCLSCEHIPRCPCYTFHFYFGSHGGLKICDERSLRAFFFLETRSGIFIISTIIYQKNPYN